MAPDFPGLLPRLPGGNLAGEHGQHLQRRIETPGGQGLGHNQLATGVGHDVSNTVLAHEVAPLTTAQDNLAYLLTVSGLNHRCHPLCPAIIRPGRATPGDRPAAVSALLSVLQNVFQQGNLVTEALDLLDLPADGADVALQPAVSNLYGRAFAGPLNKALPALLQFIFLPAQGLLQVLDAVLDVFFHFAVSFLANQIRLPRRTRWQCWQARRQRSRWCNHHRGRCAP